MNKTLLLTLFLALGILSGTALCKAQNTVESSQILTIQSKILSEERVMLVQLPEGYASNEVSYPVLFLLDGNTHFQHAVAATDYLNRLGEIPPMIVVALTNTDRNRNFLPTHTGAIPTSGEANKFQQFLKEELIPRIEQEFRAAPYRILMGHSFGGTFATFTFLTQPELFEAYLAFSPVIHYDNSYLLGMAKAGQTPEKQGNKNFFMTVGNEPNYYEAHNTFDSLMKQQNSINYCYLKMPDENHGSIPYVSLYRGLRFVYSDWRLPQEFQQKDLATLDAYYAKLSKKYGYPIHTPENIINMLGYRYLQAGDIKTALLTFIENSKRYPGSSNVFDSLGEAYEQNKEWDKARDCYEKAYTLGKLTNHPNTALYKANLDRVSEQLKK
ncbi:MAG: alpha/beta hydrolase-fold protein [Salinivirgaceae bacterium]